MHKYTVYIAELYGKLDSEKKERQGKKYLTVLSANKLC